jgi:3',5'-cyclic AMP phosphodiesterase CpdA
VFTLAHLSDLHATPVSLRWLTLSPKQALGWLKWSFRRSKQHRPEVLDALIADLRAEKPDHVVVTGDLTNLGMKEEFPGAVAWLQRLGNGRQVSVVPGNHDAYVALPQASSWGHWAEYLESDALERTTPTSAQNGCGLMFDFPSLRVRGPVALIGVNSARPVGLFRANGRVGRQQLEKLEKVLGSLADSGLCRIVFIHHPPIEEGLTKSRRLADAAALREVLKSAGAELVLHGHTHRTVLNQVPGPEGLIPVVGVRSASDIGHRPGRGAQYHLYRIERRVGVRDGRGFLITMTTRSYNEKSGLFLRDGEQDLLPFP